MSGLQDITAAFNVPTTGTLVMGGDNSGSNIDFSAGSPSGSRTSPSTGNSLLDSIAAFSALAVNEVSKGLQSYGGFLESSAVANAAKRLNTTPTMVQGSLPTVPLATNTATDNKKLFLYVGGAALAAVVVLKILKR